MPVDLSPIEISPGERTEIAEFGASHRTSMLTLMFTDLAGSTEMWEQLGENAASKLRREHHQMEQEIVERDNGGRVIKTIGDAIFAVFAEPSRAVERAMEIQLELHARNQVRSQKLQERIGLHLGQVLLEHHVVDDVFGRHVNRAARIEGSTPPGHVFASHSVWDSASGWLQEKYRWKYQGEYRFKGISHPERLWEPLCPPLDEPGVPVGGQQVEPPGPAKATHPSILIVDNEGLPRDVLRLALERRGFRDITVVRSPLSAYHPVEEGQIHAIFLNLEAGGDVEESLRFVKTTRERWPSVGFVLFVDWERLGPKLPEYWRSRFGHYFLIDRRTGLQYMERSLAVSIDGLIYDTGVLELELDWPIR